MRQSKLLVTVITLALLTAMVAGCKGPPLAVFAADVTNGQAPLSVTFSNTSTNADEFQWDFGDGATTKTIIAEEPVVHEYTKAGTHTATLTAIQEGEPQLTSVASLTITVSPDALDTVTLASIQLAAGKTEQLEAVATDQYGNPVREVDVAWTVTDEDAGSVTQTGLFTAGEVVGAFGEVVEVEVTQEELVRTAVASATITPGPLEQVVIAPSPVEIGMEMTQQFVAVGADQYGNRISGLSFTWSVENGGGTIDARGLFTVGDTPGTYNETVKAEATQGSITQSGTASVTVEPDRIVFGSNREDDQFDIYIMDIDGTNVERLTTTSAREHLCSWSPDGRRIVYASWLYSDGILVMNDDGSWTLLLIENESPVVYIYPAWSPDGSKITFIKATVGEGGSFEDMDIFVMDVDGGNVTQLTDTSDGTEWVPTWSPDGSEIVYDFTPEGQRGDIYVMNADGSNRRRLTSHVANDTHPVWSPDGTQIAFISERDGDYEIYVMNADGTDIRKLTSNSGVQDDDPDWSPDGKKIVFTSDRDTPDKGEIYVMDADGTNVVRLTDNSSNDADPCWSPRKRGVEVTEASVIIPNISTLKAMTTQEVAELARKAVVRIETDLGSGSGFTIDPSGLIMTCNHVISDAEEITVYLEDGTSYTGTVEARDLVRDLALIKIKATELPYLELGDLSEVSLGQQVVVLGYPWEAENVSVTSGLVSTIDFDSGRNITWVQTDSAINPGNSGGPMLDLRGRVIGVVSAKMVGVAVEGMGFAISANTVIIYLPRLEAGETIMAFS